VVGECLTEAFNEHKSFSGTEIQCDLSEEDAEAEVVNIAGPISSLGGQYLTLACCLPAPTLSKILIRVVIRLIGKLLEYSD
jgi:hypothetical protein